jgi:hypothetical protein
MNCISGLEKSQAPWHLRWFYTSEEQLLKLGAQIAFENYRARLNRIFDVGSDELYHPLKV